MITDFSRYSQCVVFSLNALANQIMQTAVKTVRTANTCPAIGFPWRSFPLLRFRQLGRAVIGGEQFHLLDGDLVEAGEAFGLS